MTAEGKTICLNGLKKGRLHVNTPLLIALFWMVLVSAPASQAVNISSDEMKLEETSSFSREALRQRKDESMALLKRNFFNGNLEGIGALAWRLIEISPDDPELRALYALHLFSKGTYDPAQKQLKAAQRLDPNAPLVLDATAMAAFTAENYRSAILIAREAIAKGKGHPFPHNLIGSAYFKLNRLNLAAESYRSALSVNPQFAPAYTNLGFLAIRQRDFKNAFSYFTKSLDAPYASAAAHYGLALVFDHEGNTRSAMKHLQKSLEVKPNQFSVLEKLAELQLKAGLYAAAMKTASQFEDDDKRKANRVRAEAYLHTGDPDKALVLLVNSHDTDPTTRFLMGAGYMQTGKYHTALPLLDEVINESKDPAAAQLMRLSILNFTGKRVRPDDMLAVKGSKGLLPLKHFLAGCLSAQQGGWPQAVALWRQATGLFHCFSLEDVQTDFLKNNLKRGEFKYVILGTIYLSQRMEMAGVKQFQLALQENANSIMAHYLMAQAHRRLGQREKAIAHFKASLRQDPEFRPALIALGDIGFSSHDVELANVYYGRALSQKSDPTLLYRLGSIHEAAGDMKKAEERYRQLVSTYPDVFIGYNQLAWFYAKHGIHLDESLDLARRADRLQPNNPIILDTIGWIHFRKKDLKGAEKYLKRAIDLSDQIPSILYHYGAVMRAEGKSEIAKHYMRKALDISDQFEDADDAKMYTQAPG